MIGDLIAGLAGRVGAAIAVRTTDETMSVTVDADGDISVETEATSVLGVRVVDRGRLGFASGAADRSARVVDAAVASAEVGDPVELILPAASPVASVVTSAPNRPTSAELLAAARGLRDRIRREDLVVEAWAECSGGDVEVGNSRGVLQRYDVSLAGIGATVVDRKRGTTCRAHCAEAGLPDGAAADRLAGEIARRLEPAPLEDVALGPSVRVWFEPRAVRTLLQPLQARLAGERWAEGKFPAELDPRLTLIDDSLAAGRPGSRPIDDDGVVTRRLTLIDRGAPVRGVLDLATASRHRLPATGHGWHRGFAAPRVGFSNLILEAGTEDAAGLARALGSGLVVSDLSWGPAPNPDGGTFRVRVPWCFSMERGAIAGRLENAVLSGTVFDLLRRVIAVGNDNQWIGAASVPSLVIDAVGLSH